MWNSMRDASPNFLDELYGASDVEQFIEQEEEEVLDEEATSSDDDEIGGGICEPSTSRGWGPIHRDRSRSPIGRRAHDPLPSLDFVIHTCDATGTPPEDSLRPGPVGLTEVVKKKYEHFMTPDAHALYNRAERLPSMLDGMDESKRGKKVMAVERGAEVDDTRGTSARGRMRSERRVCTSGRGRLRRNRERSGCRQRSGTWKVGHPLEEIWVTDDDVPLELREMARDVVRRRQMSAQVSTKQRSTREKYMAEGDDSASEVEDEMYHDSTDRKDNSILEDDHPHFDWHPMDSFRGEEEKFKPTRTGSVSIYNNPYDAFHSFWDDSIMQTIVDETNRYATKIPSDTFQKNWYPTNSHEVMCMFAFWMSLGIIRMPTIHSCFSKDFLLKTEIFSRITSYGRYCNLNRALCFVDTDPAFDAAYPTISGAASFDREHRLRPIIDHLNSKFQSNYVMSKDICIDESLTLWKGRLPFRQYIRSKAAKYGLKTFELCESATGYLWSFLVYTGKQYSLELDSNLSKSTAIVQTLMRPLLNKGYRLFMDNWFSSPLLARFLKRNGTDCVGTLRSTRQHVPELVTGAPLRQGQLIARHSGDVCVLSWQDHKRVNMISTCHGSAVGLSTVSSHPPRRPLPYKPQVVLDYNKSMGGLDLKDQMLEPYLLERKRCVKWYLKIFKRLLNCSIHNARVLMESSIGGRLDSLQFRLELIEGILTHHHHLIPLSRNHLLTPHPLSRILNHSHWLVCVPQTQYELSKNRHGRAKCTVCLKEKKTTRTRYMCQECNVPLCVEPCYKIHHTIP